MTKYYSKEELVGFSEHLYIGIYESTNPLCLLGCPGFAIDKFSVWDRDIPMDDLISYYIQHYKK